MTSRRRQNHIGLKEKWMTVNNPWKDQITPTKLFLDIDKPFLKAHNSIPTAKPDYQLDFRPPTAPPDWWRDIPVGMPELLRDFNKENLIIGMPAEYCDWQDLASRASKSQIEFARGQKPLERS
jgi:hypothetical protein